MDSSLENSHSTEIFAFEGPLVSDGVDTFEEKVGNALKASTEWKFKDRGIRIIDTISVRSQRLPVEKSLSAIMQPVIRSEWNEEG